MARTTRTADDIESLSMKISAIAGTLQAIAASMRESGIPDVLVHSGMPENAHIPAIEDWSDKLKVDVRSQIRSYSAGSQSNAELQKRKSESMKSASAKKAPKKKLG